jgi:hypothetical protein
MPTEEYICPHCDDLDEEFCRAIEVEEAKLEVIGRILDHREKDHSPGK